MLVSFIAMGYDQSIFWDLTPNMFYIYQRAYEERTIEEYNSAMSVAYVAASLVMAEKRPKLDELLAKRSRVNNNIPELSTDEELNRELADALMNFMR